MDQRVFDFADVAMLFFVGLYECSARQAIINFIIDLVIFNKFGWKNIGCDKDWFGTKRTNSGLSQILLVARGLFVFVATTLIFDEFAT